MHTISGHIVSLPAVAGVYILFTFFFYPMDGMMSDDIGAWSAVGYRRRLNDWSIE